MKHTDLYYKYKELEAIEREELKQAVLAHGGEFRFKTTDWETSPDVQPPVVIAGGKHWESYCDCVITRVAVIDGCLEIYGYDKEYGDQEMLLEVETGHLGYIIDEIPETEEVDDVSLSEQDLKKIKPGSVNDKIVEEIAEWATSSVAFLSESTEYARGYKQAFALSKAVVRNILREYNPKLIEE